MCFLNALRCLFLSNVITNLHVSLVASKANREDEKIQGIQNEKKGERHARDRRRCRHLGPKSSKLTTNLSFFHYHHLFEIL